MRTWQCVIDRLNQVATQLILNLINDPSNQPWFDVWIAASGCFESKHPDFGFKFAGFSMLDRLGKFLVMIRIPTVSKPDKRRILCTLSGSQTEQKSRAKTRKIGRILSETS